MHDSNPALSAPRGSLPADAEIDQRYVVEDLLGRGGMGYVYRVRDTASGKRVALKLLRMLEAPRRSLRALGPADVRTRDAKGRKANAGTAHIVQRLELFQREYHTLSELQHSHIIEAHDYGWDGDTPYYTMELLTGSDLARLAPLPWPRVCAVLRDVASALTLLHSRRLLHRDISPSNVHQQADGSCKLIDFGAMGAMGRTNAIVGTPPFMPPELLQHGLIDARSDLYSLGALGYYLATGRTVHPVRSLAELRAFIAVSPTPPSLHAPDLPRALDALLLELLSPDVAARPATTIEVIERLSAIQARGPALVQSELGQTEHAADKSTLNVSTLAKPAFVGREQELSRVRRRLARLQRGKGSALLISAPSGAGRSRFLDACALSAKLCGARVLRVDAAQYEHAPFTLVSALVRQLHATLGSRERELLALPAPLARALAPELLQPQFGSSPPLSVAPRASLPSAAEAARLHDPLLAYLVSVAKRRSLLITVENLERADAQSGSLLAALAQRAGTVSVIVMATAGCAPGAIAPAHIHDFSAHARELVLPALSQAETENLLASLFGEVPNLGLLAARMYALAGGNPSLTVELAQHLLESGVIRCESGGYLLPELFAESDLPSSLSEALYARARRLSPNAFALGTCLAACAGLRLTSEEAFWISALAGAGADALAELCAAQLVETSSATREQGSLYVRLRQPALAEGLLGGLAPEQRRALHGRIAALLVTDPERKLHAAEHYFHADQGSLGIDTLLSAAAANHAGCAWHPDYRTLIDKGLVACRVFGRPQRDGFLLEQALAEHVLNYNEACDAAQLLTLSGTLSRLSGLTDFAELSPTVDAKERLGAALGRAQARYDEASEQQRILPPKQAIPQLTMYLMRLTGFASSSFDIELLHAIPSLSAFAPLSPSILVFERLLSSLRDLRAGRTEDYLAGVDVILERLAQADCAGFPPAQARGLRINLLYGIALANGALGREIAFVHAAEMEGAASQVINAWRVRQIAHLFLCKPADAELCRREVELLQLLQSSRQFHHGGTVETEALVYAQGDDLLGLRRVLPAIERMAAVHSGWRPVELVARASLQRVRGRLEEALVLYSEALTLAPAGRHMLFCYAAGGHLQTLVELGRAEEARAHGRLYLVACEQHNLRLSRHRIEIPLSHAECLLGAYEAATPRVERMVVEVEDSGQRGLFAGVVYEAAARCALFARNAQAFERYYESCLKHMPEGRFPALTVRLERLRAGARRAWLAPARESALSEGDLGPAFVKSQLSMCVPVQRSARALELAMNATGAVKGHLYSVTESALVLRASSGADSAPEHLTEFLQRYLVSADLLRDQTVDLSYETTLRDSESGIEPLALSVERHGARVVVALLALTFDGVRRWPTPELLDAIAEQVAGVESDPRHPT